MTSGAVSSLPGLDGALVLGDVFFAITLVGDPQHKARHRSRVVFPKAGKPFIHNYPDPTTEAFEKMLAQVAALKMRRTPPSEKPLCLLVIADRRIPVSWSTKDRAAALAGRILPTSKPDFDNHAKIVDALNSIVWRDDSQVVDARVIKRYSASPALTIEVREFISPF
jgi:Holliday junction resolvase RusA-like endonuclease